MVQFSYLSNKQAQVSQYPDIDRIYILYLSNKQAQISHYPHIWISI